MRKNILFLLAAALFLPAVSVSLRAAVDGPYLSKKTYAFTNVDVIPMTGDGKILRDRTVIVRGGVIAEIGKSGEKIPADASVIDGRGKYLLPGFADLHTHLFSDYEFPDELAEDELKIMLANGVTTIRLMIGTPEHLELRRRSARGEILAPKIYAASPQFAGFSFGKIFNGFVVSDPEAARRAVRRVKRDGYDFIKLTFGISRPVYDAITDEAEKQKIPVIGHVDPAVGLERVFETGQQIEHLDGFFEALLPRDSAIKISTSGINVWKPEAWQSLDLLEEERIPELAARAVRANPYSVPTLVFLNTAFGTGQSAAEIRARPDYRFLPEKIRREMERPQKSFWSRPPDEKRRRRYVELRRRMVKAIHEAGGKVLAGSDAPEWFLLYGFTLHRELEALARAGLSNYAVLEAATRHPAEFFGALDESGTIEAGKRADLVLLEADPLADISNTKKIAGVSVRGNWLPKSEIERMLERIAPRFQKAFDQKEKAAAKAEPFGKGVFADGKEEIFRGTFAPDGKTLYFFKKVVAGQEEYRIFESNLIDGKWSAPKKMTFGGEHSDMYPALSRDGRRLVFSSYRPAPGDRSDKPNAHLWMVEKQKDGSWSEPSFLKEVNRPGHYHAWVEFGPDGNLYFRQVTPDWRDRKTLVSRLQGGKFSAPVPFAAAERWKNWKKEVRINGGSPGPRGEVIFLDVAARNPETGRGASDIWISVKKDGRWQEPRPLGKNVNTAGFDVFPFFSPDGSVMYFVRDFKEFYKIPLQVAIESAGK